MNRPDEGTAALTSRNIYIDDAPWQSSSYLSASEPLLEEDNQSTNPISHRPTWKAWLSAKNISRSRRKPSRPGNDTGEKLRPKKRKRSRLCLKMGLGILIFLYVLEMDPDAAYADFS